jgi:ribosomal protein S18 acetylase RimI-like enzyme
VPRTPVSTRAATVADVPLLVGLWGELRHVGARAERAVNPLSVPDVSARLAEAITSDDCRVVVALTDDEVAGMAVLRELLPDPLSMHRVVQVSHVIVASGKRRRGVGHALIGAAADFADERQIEHVSAGVYPSLRDVSRFYARLGFAPVMVHRVAPVAMLRRRLGGGYGALHSATIAAVGPDSALGRVDDLVRRRTRLRRPVPAQRARVRQTERTD